MRARVHGVCACTPSLRGPWSVAGCRQPVLVPLVVAMATTVTELVPDTVAERLRAEATRVATLHALEVLPAVPHELALAAAPALVDVDDLEHARDLDDLIVPVTVAAKGLLERHDVRTLEQKWRATWPRPKLGSGAK